MYNYIYEKSNFNLSLIFIPNILMANCPDLLNQKINNIQGDSVNCVI